MQTNIIRSVVISLEAGITKDHEETFGNDEQAHYLDCGDGFVVYICQNSSVCIL